MNNFKDKDTWRFVKLQQVLSDLKYCKQISDFAPVIFGCKSEKTIIRKIKN